MKKIICKTLIATMFSTSLIGCAGNETPELFGQKVYSSNKDMENNGYILKSTSNDKRFFEKESLNSGKISVTMNGEYSSSIKKISDHYPLYETCLESFNEDNKIIQEVINKGESEKILDENNKSFRYGSNIFKIKSEPCSQVVNNDIKESYYQYKIDIDGLTQKESKEILKNIGVVSFQIITFPFMLVAMVVIVPIGLLYWAITCKFFGGYCGG